MNQVQAIIELVSRETGISVDEILSRRKIASVVSARHIAMVLAYEMLPDVPMRRLVWEFKKDHTTIKMACGRLSLKKPAADMSIVEKLRPLVREMVAVKRNDGQDSSRELTPWMGAKGIVAMLLREIAVSGIPLSTIEQEAKLTFGFLSRYRCKYPGQGTEEGPPMPIWAVCNLCRYLGYKLQAVPLDTSGRAQNRTP